jgi:hypothetical protein
MTGSSSLLSISVILSEGVRPSRRTLHLPLNNSYKQAFLLNPAAPIKIVVDPP